MNYRFNIVVVILIASIGWLNAQQINIPANYTLVVDENFDAPKLDYRIWNNKPDWGQNFGDSAQCVCNCSKPSKRILSPRAVLNFTNDTANIKIANGTATLICKKANVKAEYWRWDSLGNFIIEKAPARFTSGMIFSKAYYGKGYYEIRFKLPSPPTDGKTYKPFGANFWTYSGGCWNEIDGFEIMDGQKIKFTNNVHFVDPKTPNCTNNKRTHKDASFDYGSITPGWHTYGFNWTDRQIDFYLDGKKMNTTRKKLIKKILPMQLFIWISAPQNQCIPLTDERVAFPYTYEIDYIKIWQANVPTKP